MLNSLKSRLRKLEKKDRENKTAFFIVQDGKASGRAWWREGLEWKDLSRPEFETLEKELTEKGVHVQVLDLAVAIERREDGTVSSISGWDVKEEDFKPGGKFNRREDVNE